MSQGSYLKLNILVVRLVMVSWLFGWYVKAYFLIPYFREVAFQVRIYHPLFPEFFVHPMVSFIAYMLPVFCIPAIFMATKRRLMFSSVIMIVCSLILMGHLNAYNDATFVTSFWVGIWLLWLSSQSDRHDSIIRQQACMLAKLIVGVIFFAGFVGKLTPEYVSGEAFYNIFWTDNDLWPHKWLISQHSPDQLRIFSAYFSMAILAVELILSCLPIFRFKYVYLIAVVLMAGFTITNTWAILSVLGCLIGMMFACFIYQYVDEKVNKVTHA